MQKAPQLTSDVVDFAHEGDLSKSISELEAKYGVQVTLVGTDTGSGGWPEVTVSGDSVNVRHALLEAWFDGSSDHLLWVAGVTGDDAAMAMWRGDSA